MKHAKKIVFFMTIIVCLMILCIHGHNRFLKLPDPTEVSSVKIIQYSNDRAVENHTITKEDDISNLFNQLKRAADTGIPSETETPAQEEYGEIQIYFQKNAANYAKLYFYYSSNSCLIERPFDKIYILEDDLSVIPEKGEQRS